MKRAVLYTRLASYKATENQVAKLQNYCNDKGIAIAGQFSDIYIGENRGFQGLFDALELMFKSAYEKKPIDYLIIPTSEIHGYCMNILDAELVFYCTELLVIENYE